MNDTDTIRTVLSEVGATMSRRFHREDHYTMAICANLWQMFKDRMFVAVGLDVGALTEVIGGTKVDELRIQRLPPQMLALNQFTKNLPPTHVFEFKFLNAFPTLPKKVARADSYKLYILGQYIQRVSGTMPYLEQVLFTSTRTDKRIRSVAELSAWFQDEEIKTETEGVHVSIIDADGRIHRAK
jgi:hypothetical protein